MEKNYKTGDIIYKYNIVQIPLPQGSIIKIIGNGDYNGSENIVGILYLILLKDSTQDMITKKMAYAIRLSKIKINNTGLWTNINYNPDIEIVRYGL